MFKPSLVRFAIAPLMPPLGRVTTVAVAAVTGGLSLFAGSPSALALPLSPGDRIRLVVSEPLVDAQLAEQFRLSGLYEVNLDGQIEIPFMQPIPAINLEVEELEKRLRDEMLKGGLFQPDFLQVSAEVSQWAPVQVSVSGAVFTPGQILADGQFETANTNRPANRNLANTQPVTVSGDYPVERFVTSVLRQAGGVTPNADLTAVRLIRQGEEQSLDLSGVLSGDLVEDLPLIAGDQVIVPELELEQAELVRPSPITPSHVDIYLSNQAQPRGGNVAGRTVQLAYGTRFAQAAISASCGGGASSTNANRRVTLVRTNALNGEATVLDRSVEKLLRNPTEVQEGNPYIMPSDSVVCYDSKISNTSSILDFVGKVLNPFSTILRIFKD